MAKTAVTYVIKCYDSRRGTERTTEPMTITEAVAYFSYDLECGASYEHEKGNKKINRNPKTIDSLIKNII